MNRLRTLLADSGPVAVLAVIAAVGSFDHISALAAKYGQHGWRAWAVAVCIDLMCVMAAREIQRDKRTGRRPRGWVSWPHLVLSGGIVLTLAANLAEAPSSAWGWVLAATPAGAFLIAMSMLERRAGHSAADDASDDRVAVPTGLVWEDSSLDQPSDQLPTADARPRVHADAARLDDIGDADALPGGALDAAAPAELTAAPASNEPAAGLSSPSTQPPAALLAYARRVADEHEARHHRPITADLLRSRMKVGPELAASLLAHLQDPNR
ncbi:DUF2637 domain-containing protein [Nonomuraea sp. NPDC049486]|uniref:DUF2637 domain-containing protein n=1 Tax=Nonomuraea sp. NPDC049486 TaxID=3155773 RepID=UPI0034493205